MHSNHSLRETEASKRAGVLLEQTIFDYAKRYLILGKYLFKLSRRNEAVGATVYSRQYTAVKLNVRTHFNDRK